MEPIMHCRKWHTPWLRTSEIALGEIRSIDEEAARHAPGVLEILTYRNVGKAVGLPDLLYQ
jgi:CO/xanthine dehydrogenase Mo-binding subunit